MDIISATKHASSLNTAIYRMDDINRDSILMVVPLSKFLMCPLIVMPMKYLHHRPETSEEWKEVHITPGWNPSLEDLLSDEWCVLNGDDFNDIWSNGSSINQEVKKWKQ